MSFTLISTYCSMLEFSSTPAELLALHFTVFPLTSVHSKCFLHLEIPNLLQSLYRTEVKI